jgi:hypothetical protein
MESPFLTNEVLRNVLAIELKGVNFAAAELLDHQQAIGAELVVDEQLNNALETGYNQYIMANGRPPDAVQNRAYPERFFIPRKWPVRIATPGGLFVPTTREVLLFFAIRKGF